VKRNVDLPPLYPIVDVRRTDREAHRAALDFTRRLTTGGATLVQLRAKKLSSGGLEALAAELIQDLSATACRLIVNDRTDIAMCVGAAGVHLGQEDTPADLARRIAGDRMIIGVSTHSPGEATAVDSSIVDYLAFGPVFDSPTKAGVREPRGLDQLEQVCRASAVPVVAIGGITLATAAQAWSAGAASVAVINDLERADDAARVVANYLDAASRYPRSS
jgi:thiamine-phosphate pyrophosphorylase